jgi:hypothetical protein
LPHCERSTFRRRSLLLEIDAKEEATFKALFQKKNNLQDPLFEDIPRALRQVDVGWILRVVRRLEAVTAVGFLYEIPSTIVRSVVLLNSSIKGHGALIARSLRVDQGRMGQF